MAKEKKVTLKSQYDIVMEQFEKEGKVKHFSDEENAAILRGLNEGTAEFDRQCTINQIESERELANIILD